MTKQQPKAKSSIEQLRLQEDPTSQVGMLPDTPDLASPLAAGSGHTAINNGIVANQGKPLDGQLTSTPTPEAVKDFRPIVKRIWQKLTDPNRPFDSLSFEYRVGQIRCLERLTRTEFACTADARQHIERYLEGYDGRRLPFPQAIKKARKRLKLTQPQLAELLGFKNHALISKLESGKRLPNDRVIEWLRKVENVTRKKPVKGSSRTPHFSVTSNRGKKTSSSPNLGDSETSPKRQDCTPASHDLPASTPEVL